MLDCSQIYAVMSGMKLRSRIWMRPGMLDAKRMQWMFLRWVRRLLSSSSSVTPERWTAHCRAGKKGFSCNVRGWDLYMPVEVLWALV